MKRILGIAMVLGLIGVLTVIVVSLNTSHLLCVEAGGRSADSVSEPDKE